MFNQRSATPLGMRLILKILMPAVIIALALIYADPAYSKGKPDGAGANASQKPHGPKPRVEEGPASDGGGDAPVDGEAVGDAPTGDNDENTGSEEELKSPIQTDDDDPQYESQSDDSGSFFLVSSRNNNQAKRRYEHTRKELARLFVLTNTQVATEFPDGGFDRALVQAANRARRAERAFRP